MIIIGFNADNEIIISKFENFFKTSLVARGGLQDIVVRPGNCVGMNVINRRIGFLNDESEMKLLTKRGNHWISAVAENNK